jgi:hypothetical protein
VLCLDYGNQALGVWEGASHVLNELVLETELWAMGDAGKENIQKTKHA